MTKDHDDATVYELWLEDEELDRALRELHAEVTTEDEVISRGRAKVLAAATTLESKKSKRSWATAAAAVAVLTAGVLVSQALVSGEDDGHAAAAATLDRAAGGVREPTVHKGQYRYVETQAWWAVGTEIRAGFQEKRVQIWVPADRTQDWLQRGTVFANRPSIPGPGDTVPPGPPQDVTEWRAACGDYFATGQGRKPCEGQESGWQNPTPQWQAGLPRDPVALFERLRADAPPNSRGDKELLVIATDALSTGLLDADVRAALYQALAKIPELTATDGAVNLDGRTGTALGLDDGETREEIVIDPQTGEFLGEREVLTQARGSSPQGTVIGTTSVRISVADQAGTVPAS